MRAALFTTNAPGIFVEALDVAAAVEGLTVEAEPLYPKLGAGPRSGRSSRAFVWPNGASRRVFHQPRRGGRRARAA